MSSLYVMANSRFKHYLKGLCCGILSWLKNNWWKHKHRFLLLKSCQCRHTCSYFVTHLFLLSMIAVLMFSAHKDKDGLGWMHVVMSHTMSQLKKSCNFKVLQAPSNIYSLLKLCLLLWLKNLGIHWGPGNICTRI